MTLHRWIDEPGGSRDEPLGRRAGPRELRRTVATGSLGIGTLACPACDAPVAPHGVMTPTDRLGCGFCSHRGAVRDFLSLAHPARPARVEVRLAPR